MALNHPITEWSGRTVWIVGGSAGIGAALGQALQDTRARLIVSGRRLESLEAAFPDPSVRKEVFDITDRQAGGQVLARLAAAGWVPDLVFWVAGDYQPQPIEDFDPADAHRIIETNLSSAYDGLWALLQHWIHGEHPLAATRRAQGLPPPHICWFSSVAGYRGLPLALSYGASKAGLNAMAETCFLELKPHAVDVSLVCPGFVRTRLTEGNDFTMPALISAEEAARETLAGLAQGRFEIHYPRRFTRVMKTLRILPYRLYFWLVAKTLRKPGPAVEVPHRVTHKALHGAENLRANEKPPTGSQT
jgi:NAD(P)-dependent dehydrogenase (short-subunit alcohol dehydrogenase family)